MKSNRAVQSSVDISNLTVPDAEEIIEEALSELAFSQDPGLARALRFLAPPGYQAIVELCGENGRSKRRNAAAESWSPEEDEVRIYFERLDDNAAGPVRQSRASRASLEQGFEDDVENDTALPADVDARVKELCAALAEAEKGRTRFHRAEVVPRFLFAAQGFPLESASGIETSRARRGHSTRRSAYEQNRKSKNSRLSHNNDSIESLRSRRAGRSTEIPSSGGAG